MRAAWKSVAPRCRRRSRAASPCSSAISTRGWRSEEHTSELQSPCNLVCRLLLEKKYNNVGNRLFSTDPNGHTPTTISDALNRLSQTAAPDCGVLQLCFFFFFLNNRPTPKISPLPPHAPLPT